LCAFSLMWRSIDTISLKSLRRKSHIASVSTKSRPRIGSAARKSDANRRVARERRMGGAATKPSLARSLGPEPRRETGRGQSAE
jgi:hypothetical protein